MYVVGKDFWFIEDTDSTRYKYVLSAKITTEDNLVLTWNFGIMSQDVAINKEKLNESIAAYICEHRSDARSWTLALIEL